jgi:hypothetical protein
VSFRSKVDLRAERESSVAYGNEYRRRSLLTLYGVVVITFMMVMYALEGRGARFVLAFAAGCALSSSYGFLSGAWPFGVVEGIWSIVALRRYLTVRYDP